jgi:serine O-acetyltransferase
MSIRETIRQDLVAAQAPLHRGAALRAWLISPQVRAVWLYRLSAHFARKGGAAGTLLSKWFSLSLIRRYGCHISPQAEIGQGLSLPHPVGIVIGRGVKVGHNVTIYQGVTLGVRNKSVDEYPTIGDNVTLYAGAVIAGGVLVGPNAAVGANAVVLHDVPGRGVEPAVS